MPLLETFIAILVRFGEILVAPIKYTDMLWIIVPIYIAWILGDYYQERKGTDFGNAMSNGFVAVWVGLDWTRQIVKGEVSAGLAIKIAISIIFIIYGLAIMIESARAKKVAHYLGRIRIVSYFMIVATPIYYGVAPVDIITVSAVLLFLPIWYGVAELIDRVLPAPPSESETEMPDLKGIGTGDIGAGFGTDFGSQQPEMPSGNFGQQPRQGLPPNF